MNSRRFAALACALLTALPVAAAPVQTDHIEAELVAEFEVLAPGPNALALRLAPEKGWHTYWRNPGDSGQPTEMRWKLPQGFEAGPIQWPYPHRQQIEQLANYGYGEETLHLVTLAVPANVVGRSVTLKVQAKWLVCADICIPGQADLSLELPVAAAAGPPSRWQEAFKETRQHLPRAEPLQARFAVDSGEFRLAADDAMLAQARHLEFFPFANDLLNHGAEQRLAKDGGAIRIAQPVSSFFVQAPAVVEGVLVAQGSPGSPTRAYNVRAVPGDVAAVPATASKAPAQPGLLQILGFAFLGGLILNLMPCVFPVLAIKAVSVLEAYADNRRAERAHALVYTAGVVLSCASVAALLMALRASGEQIGWGFQLQSPVFLGVLAYLLFTLGLSLAGVLAFGTRLMGVGQGLAAQGGYSGSFFTGVLATVVAAPCTAPFMGVALGYALTQPAAVALLVFMVLGLGLAAPFLLLGFFPRLASALPRPGAWMESFKQAMAFPLFLTVAWLVWVLARQAGADAAGLVLAGLVLVAFAAWLHDRGGWVRGLRYAAVISALALLAHPALEPAAPASVEKAGADTAWSATRVAELRAQGRPVFVNFTADWCITCKVNEKVALDSERVRAAFAARNVAWLTADWTRSDPEITRVLESFGQPGVPLYLLYPPSGDPKVLPQILTPDIVVEALDQLSLSP